jgi:hypothetical protein
MDTPCSRWNDLTQDPILGRLLRGEAATADEAEEQYLDQCLPELVQLLQTPLTDDQLAEHPLIRLLLTHGSRSWEDSLL